MVLHRACACGPAFRVLHRYHGGCAVFRTLCRRAGGRGDSHRRGAVQFLGRAAVDRRGRGDLCRWPDRRGQLSAAKDRWRPCRSASGLAIAGVVGHWCAVRLRRAGTGGSAGGGGGCAGKVPDRTIGRGAVGMHQVWLLLALTVFGVLFGFDGLVLAVPLAAAEGALARLLTERYLESPLCTGQAAPPEPELPLRVELAPRGTLKA